MTNQEPIIDILLSHVEKKESLPPLSNNAQLLQKEVTQSTPDMDKITNMIKADPALTSHVLKIANSVIYKGLEKIDTVKEALLRLGLDEIRNIAMWGIHQSNFKADDPFIKKHKKRLWFHSLSCATGAAWTANYLSLDVVQPKAFIAGLLHDIGILYLLTALEKLKTDKRIPTYPSEFLLQEVINQFHTEQGYELLKHWNLPEQYLIVSNKHHDDKFDHSNLLLVLIRLMDKICLKMETGNKPEDMAALINSDEVGILGISELGLAEIEIGIEEAQTKFSSLF